MRKKDAQVFLFVTFLHWLCLLLCWALLGDTYGEFVFWDRLYTAGDAPHYLRIAQEGYAAAGEYAKLIVFFPLYPFLTGLLGRVIGFEIAGMLISQIAYGGASVFLYRLIALDRGEKDAWYGVLFMCLYPFCFFTMGVYTEGLFLLLTIGGLYFIRRHRYLAAGIFGFLGALTRIQGVLLLIPAAYALFTGKKKKGWPFLLLIPMGLAVYLWMNKAVQGDWLIFLQHEAAAPWYQTTQWIADNLAMQYRMGRTYDSLALLIYDVQIAVYFLSLAVLVYGFWKKERASYLVYGGAYLGFTYLSGWMISGGRYMLGCAPLFIILSGIPSDRARNGILCVLAFLFALYFLLFMRGFAIM